jgi:hypothetical protein
VLEAASLTSVYGPVGLIVGVIGIVGTVIGVSYARRRPALVFYQEGQLILRGRPEDELAVAWRGQPVPAFSRTRLWVWNAGTATLDRRARVPGYPLLFAWSDGHQVDVLSVRIISTSRAENGVCVAAEMDRPGHVSIDFEYLDPQDGVVFEVEHTASTWRASASGTLKGARTTLRERMPKTYFPEPSVLVAPAALLAVIPAILLSAALTSKHSGGAFIAAGAVFGALACVFGYLWLIGSRPGPPPRMRAARDSKLLGERIDPRGVGLPK